MALSEKSKKLMELQNQGDGGLFPKKEPDKTNRVLNYPGLEYFYEKIKSDGSIGNGSVEVGEENLLVPIWTNPNAYNSFSGSITLLRRPDEFDGVLIYAYEKKDLNGFLKAIPPVFARVNENFRLSTIIQAPDNQYYEVYREGKVYNDSITIQIARRPNWDGSFSDDTDYRYTRIIPAVIYGVNFKVHGIKGDKGDPGDPGGLTAPRRIGLSGVVYGGAYFDGTEDIDIVTDRDWMSNTDIQDMFNSLDLTN